MGSNQLKLKIGFVFDDSLDKPDGVQQYILSLGSWLTAQGHTVHYLVGQTKRTDMVNVHSLSRNVSVTFNGNVLSVPLPASRRQIKALLDAEQFNVLHVQMPYSPWLAQQIILAAPPNTVIFGTFHIVAFSKLVTAATKVLAWWTRRSLQGFSEIVSVSSAAQTYARQTYGIDTTVLPNVVDYNRFAAARSTDKTAKTVSILFLGRLVERKGCQYLLEAVQLLQARGVGGFNVTICGRGGLKSQLEKYVREHDLPVTFVGFVSEDDKPSHYAAADIAVFPSTGGESFGIVLIEAMANGRTAVLGAANSGYTSVLETKPEALFPVRDHVALADRLEYLLNHPAERQALAQWEAEYARQYDIAVVGKTLISRYRRHLPNLRETP